MNSTDKGGEVVVAERESPIQEEEEEAAAFESQEGGEGVGDSNSNNNRKRKKQEEIAGGGGEIEEEDSSFDGQEKLNDNDEIMSPRRNRGRRKKSHGGGGGSPNKKTNKKKQDADDDDAASASSGASLSVSPQKQHKEGDDDSSFPIPPPPRSIQKLRLEAIFHPKFENEKQKGNDDSNMRALMKERVSDGRGYLEVSLKHSGSLLLWSGGQRFYSKNATNNIFTHVGEILLRQHFCRAHWNSKSSTSNDDDDAKEGNDSSSPTIERMYQECSDYVQQHRLTLSFEVVTAVLGDHGATPRRDFLILTAIASRSEERFYTTPELLACAHRFGLPHNDAWVFSSPQSVDALFAFYDAHRETALATGVIGALSEMAETHVASMYPHVDFQGDILEGIVIRYVRIRKSGSKEEETLSHMKRLSKASHDWAVAVPPSLADCYDLTSSQQSFPLLLRTNVRAIFQETHLKKKKKDSSAGPQQPFAGRILDVLNQSSSSSSSSQQRDQQGERRTTQRLNNHTKKSEDSLVDICNLAKEYLATTSTSNNKDDGVDTETQRIATLIGSLVHLRCRVDYSVICEQMQHYSTSNDDDSNAKKKSTIRWLCIIHVLHDSSFQKFRQSMKVGDMALFRGFVVEISGPGDGSSSSLNESLPAEDRMLLDNDVNRKTNGVDEDDPDGGSLMLKMKFLPYMVRTFGVRNGMSILRREGKEAYLKYTSNILSKWKMSKQAKQTWMPFFAAWADYAKPRMEKKLASEPDLPVLGESNYLTHLERFRELYESGQLGFKNDSGSENKPAENASSFRGLLVVVAVQRKTSDRVADWFAKELGDAARNRNLNRIDSDQIDAFCTRGSGVVCSATVDDGVSKLRRLLREHEEHISLLFYGLSDDDVTAALKEDEQGEGKGRKILGIIKGWRKTKAACLVELERCSLFQDGADTKPTDEVREALSMFEKVSEAVVAEDDDDDDEEKPLGVLVFFPSIPGSGKSSLACPEMEEKVRTALSNNSTKRELIVRMGDKTKKKYWPLVKQERLKDTSGVYIADKNLPSTTWGMVAKLCCETSTVAVPVIPDPAALQTTAITGHRKPSGEVVGSETHVYPFSLHYLAVCMMRVSFRPQGTHPGKLDGSTGLACMIVVKFFTLYRRMTSEEFMDDMESAFSRSGALLSSTAIEVPFFAKAQFDALPRELEDLLVEALQVQRGYDISKKDVKESDKYIEDLEGRLRHCLKKNKNLLSRMTADMATSQSRFLSQLSERVSEVDSGAYSAVEFDTPKSFIKLAAIDVLVNDVHSLLRDLATDPRLSTLAKQFSGDDAIEKVLQGVDYTDSRFIRQTHVTMDHWKSASQGAMEASFGALAGEKVQLSVVALLWSKTVAALEVKLPPMTSNDHELPKSKNDFSHITIWCEKGTSAVASNELPGLAEKGEAQRVSFGKPVSLTGTVTLWTM